MLSFAAMRLWDGRDRQRRLLTVAAYQNMGGVAGAFARHADQVAAAVPPHSQKLLRAILTRLVTPEGTRTIVERRELVSLADNPADVEHLLDQLVRGRLIHVHNDPDQVTTVEIVHEMLISEWPTLRRWLEDSHAMRGFVQELRQAAKQWAARGKPADLVWRGDTAQEALGHAQRQLLELSVIERSFLDAIAQHAARARRRTVVVFASIIAALALVIAGAGIAVVRVSRAEQHARERAVDTERALDAEKQARDALQGKLEIIEAERTARELAERERLAEELKRVEAEGAVELSREQLERANRELVRKISEAQAAREKAVAAEATAERLLAKERAAREMLERELQLIDQRKLK